MDERPIHSPLGASSAERWMACPGSVALIKELALPETDEPDYRANGTAAHEAAAYCLQNDQDAWELVGREFGAAIEVNVEMADAIQTYIDVVRSLTVLGSRRYVEYGIGSPIHPLFYGTVDAGIVSQAHVDIVDFKYGEGIFVEVEDNPQLKYYAYGLVKDFPDAQTVTLTIVQPRISYAPPVRSWSTTVAELKAWAEQVLFPAMQRAEVDNHLDAGEHCRFCPAKLVCPLMVSLFGAAAIHDPRALIEVDNVRLTASYAKVAAVKSYIKALEEQIYQRLMTGAEMPDAKLVPKKADRVWKPEASAQAGAIFDAGDIFTQPEMKSPAALDKLGSKGREFSKQWAYTPQTGLTVAGKNDKRPAVKVQSIAEAFPALAKQLEENR